MRVLVTRPSGQSERSAARLRELGHHPLTAPLIKIVPRKFELPPGPFDAVIATSARTFENLGARADGLRALPIYVVGEKTARAARDKGWTRIESVAREAKELISQVLAGDPRSHWLYLAGAPRSPDLELALEANQRRATPVIVYAAEAVTAMPPRAIEALRAGELDAVLHYSAHSADIFVALARLSDLDEQAAKPIHVAISARAALPLQGFAHDIRIAASPDESGLVESLREID